MPLKNNNKRIAIYEFSSILPFGRCKGSAISEVLDDGDCGLIMYYINEDIIQVSNEVYQFMRSKCMGQCHNCKDNF